MANWTLIDKATKLKINAGDSIVDFRSNKSTITSGRPPHKEDSTGLVYTTDGFGYYPSVFGLE